MMIVMKQTATEAEIKNVANKLTTLDCTTHRITGSNQSVLGVVGDHRSFDPGTIESMVGVKKVIRIMEPYKLASRSFHAADTVIKIRDVEIGGKAIVVMAGPCSVESREQLCTIAEAVSKSGAKILRGGAFKPRSSPYAFQGMGEEGLQLLREAADKHDLLVVSEVMNQSKIPLMVEYVDIVQVGARNMQNFDLLKKLGRIKKPVMLKRGMSATLTETLMAAEYIMSGGNYEVILCERGIRTFETATRNTMDISAIPLLKAKSHLPVLADPSHAVGIREHVAPMAKASVAAGADSLIIEVHHDPDNAMSDGAQSLYPEQFEQLMADCRLVATAVGRTM